MTLRFLLDTSVVSSPAAARPNPLVVKDFARFRELEVANWSKAPRRD